jgi:hypothetical protein
VDRRSLLLALPAAGFTSTAASAAPRKRSSRDLTLDEVLARHAQARGGVAALDAVRNTLNIADVAEPPFRATGRYIASADGLMRVDVFGRGAKRLVTEGIDQTGEWFWDGDKAAPEPDTAVAIASGALPHGIEFNIFGLHAMRRRGHALILEGRETIAGVNYYKIKLTLKDGFQTWRYINPETWMLERSRDLRPIHPDHDPTPVTIETQYVDFRPVKDVTSAFGWIMRNVATGAWMQTGTMQRQEYNVPDSALNFPRTAEIIPI